MKPQEELDLILKLIQKYELPLSPILEYAINEKKEEFLCDNSEHKPVRKHKTDNTALKIEKKSKTIKDPQRFNAYMDSLKQANKKISKIKKKRESDLRNQSEINKIYTTYPENIEHVTNTDFESMYERRQQIVLEKLKSFQPRSPQYIANSIGRTEWGGPINVEEIDTMLKRMPEVEYVPYGLYQLKS